MKSVILLSTRFTNMLSNIDHKLHNYLASSSSSEVGGVPGFRYSYIFDYEIHIHLRRQTGQNVSIQSGSSLYISALTVYKHTCITP